MKDIVKCVGLLLVGLFTAIFAYPFLHEAGHAVAVVLFGAKVIAFHVLPLPYVICDTAGLNTVSMVLIGLNGMFCPTILSVLFRPKSFWLWYGSFVMKGICILSFAISFIAVLLYPFGVAIKNEDIVQVMDIWQESVYILAMAMLLSIIIVTRSIIKQTPLSRIMAYFKVPMKKAGAA